MEKYQFGFLIYRRCPVSDEVLSVCLHPVEDRKDGVREFSGAADYLTITH